MVDTNNPASIYSKRKAIAAFILYTVQQGQDGEHEMPNVFLHLAKATKQPNPTQVHTEQPPAPVLPNGESPVSMKTVFILLSPHLPWKELANSQHLVQLWTSAISAVPYTDEIAQSVVDTLLQIAANTSLQLPTDVWPWLNKCPPLPPVCKGRQWGSSLSAIQTILGLRDIGTLTSYLSLIWSEWGYFNKRGYDTMIVLIREEFSGIRMEYHRKRLLQRLDYILGQLDQGLEHLQRQKPSISESAFMIMNEEKRQLKETLLEVDWKATCKCPKLLTLQSTKLLWIVAGHHSDFMCAIPLP